MNERLKQRIEASKQLAIETLQNLDMGSKSANIRAAKLQSRAETFQQVLDWSKELVGGAQ